MDKEIFESFLKELSNIIAGRVVVRFNEILDKNLDIGLPRNFSLYVSDNGGFEDIKNEVFIQKVNFRIMENPVSIMLYVKKNNCVNLCENLFMEFSDDITHLCNDIIDTMCFDIEYKYEESVYLNDFFSVVMGREVVDRIENLDCCKYIYNNIFEIKQKNDIGGIFLFY
ncbi:MAG: hypothetical protein WC002_04875 [Candidatus Muiribacteriota bacterium]|jgi:hypothetical protein